MRKTPNQPFLHWSTTAAPAVVCLAQTVYTNWCVGLWDQYIYSSLVLGLWLHNTQYNIPVKCLCVVCCGCTYYSYNVPGFVAGTYVYMGNEAVVAYVHYIYRQTVCVCVLQVESLATPPNPLSSPYVYINTSIFMPWMM